MTDEKKQKNEPCSPESADESEERILDYWTEDRMRSAQALPLPELEPESPKDPEEKMQAKQNDE